MPPQKPTTGIIASLTRPTNPLSIRRPLVFRTLYSAQRRYTRGYGTVTSENKGNTTKNGLEDSPGQSGASKSETASTGSKAPQKTQEETMMEKEEREYQAEVERHNREFANGYDRVEELVTENKVDEKFWKGAYHQSSYNYYCCFQATN